MGVGRTTPEQGEVHPRGAVFPKLALCSGEAVPVYLLEWAGFLPLRGLGASRLRDSRLGSTRPPCSEAAEIVSVSAEREVSGRLEKWGKQ